MQIHERVCAFNLPAGFHEMEVEIMVYALN